MLYRTLPISDNPNMLQQVQLSAALRCSVLSIMDWQWDKGMSIPQRQASDHLIVFIKSGKLQATIDKRNYNAGPLQAIWIAKYSQRRLLALRDSHFIAAHLDFLPDHDCRLQCIQPLIKKYVDISLLNTIGAHFQNSSNTTAQHAQNYFKQLLLRLQLDRSLVCEQSDIHDPLIRHSIELLQADPSLTAEQCALKTTLRITRFRQRFIQATGVTPGKYITTLRVSKAAQLLRESDRSIADISLACGFENSNYLYRVFKSVYHCTPNSYRYGEKISV